MVNFDSWFQMVDQAGRATRSTDDPLNVRPKAARLAIRKNFFSSRVTENWNKNSQPCEKCKNSERLQEKLQKLHRAVVAPP